MSLKVISSWTTLRQKKTNLAWKNAASLIGKTLLSWYNHYCQGCISYLNCSIAIERELKNYQLGWHSPYFFHIPLVNSLKVRWLILCLTRKDWSFSQMLLSAESGLVHSLRESPNYRLLAGRQTLTDSHLWPTMKHHLLLFGGRNISSKWYHCEKWVSVLTHSSL